MSALLHSLLARLAAGRPAVRALIDDIRAKKLTYVSRHKMKRCAFALDLVRRTGIAGDIVEAGVALGGTAILLAKLRPPGRRLVLYDVFGMIPPPGPQDEADAHRRYEAIRSGQAAGIGGDAYYGYRDDLMDAVIANLRTYGIEPQRDAVELVPGPFEQAMIVERPVAFAHIDCDWYNSVLTCIERILPRLSTGGVMVFDDYSSYAGCRKAVDERLRSRGDIEVLFDEQSIGLRKRTAS